MRHYLCLNTQTYINDDYTLLPIRERDKYEIMQWRNEQIYHLRQTVPLTREIQSRYFENVVAKLFEQERPNQILFSFLKKEECIAYGGLVHINWIDMNAEISFVMNTALEKKEFSKNWSEFLHLIEKVAFRDLNLRKLYVYAFDLRPHLYSVLEDNSYFLDACLQDHCLFNNEFKDVVIYSKLNI